MMLVVTVDVDDPNIGEGTLPAFTRLVNLGLFGVRRKFDLESDPITPEPEVSACGYFAQLPSPKRPYFLPFRTISRPDCW
jgi:hypothetical protein